ncbi:hypothetical protein JCM3774_002625 [Rhodotorula dairenensis]
MATLERTTASPDEAAETAQPAFDPTAIPRDPSPLAQLSRRPHAQQDIAVAGQDEDLIDLGREQLFAGSVRTLSSRQVEPQPERRHGRLPTTTLRPVERDGAAPVAGSATLVASLRASKQAFLHALDSLIRETLPPVKESPGLQPQDGQNETNSVAGASPTLAASSSRALLSPDPTRIAEGDATLANILETLRARQLPPPQPARNLNEMQAAERTSPLSARSRPTSAVLSVLDEVQSRLDDFAPEDWLLPTDAELARSLVSLVACLQRLTDLSVVSTPLDGARGLEPAPSLNHRDDQTLGETLERGTAALLGSARGAEGVAGVLQAVEHAERDLLWGRVDDLSGRLRVLSQARALEVAEQDAVAGLSPPDTLRPPPCLEPPARYSFDSVSLSDLPPQYSQQAGSSHTHLPPAYYDEALPNEKFDSQAGDVKHADRTSLDEPLSRNRERKVSSVVHSEKMRRDLDGVTEAIERLYVVSPQLANQRAEPDRQAQRERQLVNLGNAIERLNQGRLNDQRAAPIPQQDLRLAQTSTRAVSRPTAIRKDLESIAGDDQAFERMLDQIDKAARRTLADQRVEMTGKRKAHINEGSVQARLDALFDESEASRQDFILRHTGKGRLGTQDAVLRPRSASVADNSNSALTASEFLIRTSPSTHLDSPTRPQSVPADGGFDVSIPGGADETTTPWKSLKFGFLKRSSASRRGSEDATAALGDGPVEANARSETPFGVLPHADVDSVVELSRNLGTLHVSFWPRQGSLTTRFRIVKLEKDALLVAPEAAGPASRISLPCPVPPQEAELASVGDVYELRLSLAHGSPTPERTDLEIRTPLMPDELRLSMPSSFHCSVCDVELVRAVSITRYNALPSEHWAELLDAWMCHQDQALSDDLIAKGKGIKPRADEGLVANTYLLFPMDLMRNYEVHVEKQPTRAENGDLLNPAHCASCASLIGWQVVQPDAEETTGRAFRLLKYASYPHCADRTRPQPQRAPLSAYLTAEMLETGQAHACHRFVIEDAADEEARLLLWFFNPSIRLAFSSSNSDVQSHLCGGCTKGINAVKVFYADVTGNDDPGCAPFEAAKHERMAYPRRIVDQLSEVLRASTRVYPEANRRFGELHVGFLERL